MFFYLVSFSLILISRLTPLSLLPLLSLQVEAGAQTTYFCVRTLLEAQSWVYLIKKLTGIEEEGDGEEDGIEEAGGELSLGEGEKGEKGEEPRLVVDQWGGGESSPGGKKRKSVSIRKILT